MLTATATATVLTAAWGPAGAAVLSRGLTEGATGVMLVRVIAVQVPIVLVLVLVMVIVMVMVMVMGTGTMCTRRA